MYGSTYTDMTSVMNASTNVALVGTLRWSSKYYERLRISIF